MRCPSNGLTVSKPAGSRNEGELLFRFLTIIGFAVCREHRPFCPPSYRKKSGRALLSFVGAHLYGPEAARTTEAVRSQPALFAFDGRTRRLARTHYHSQPKPPLDLYGSRDASLVVAIHIQEPMRSTHLLGLARCLGHLDDVRPESRAFQIFTDDLNASRVLEGLASSGCSAELLQRVRLHCMSAHGVNVTHAFHHLVSAGTLLVSGSSHLAMSAAVFSRHRLISLDDDLPAVGKGAAMMQAPPCLQVRRADLLIAPRECIMLQRVPNGLGCQPVGFVAETEASQEAAATTASTTAVETTSTIAAPAVADTSDGSDDLQRSGWGDPQRSHCPADGLTLDLFTDGFGAQFSRLLAVWGDAIHRQRRPFCSRRWRVMEHGLDPAAMFRFVGGEHYGHAASWSTQSIRTSNFMVGSHEVFRQLARQRYYHHPKPRLTLFDRDTFNVAMHVRRGRDVASAAGDATRFIADSAHLACLKHLAQVLVPPKEDGPGGSTGSALSAAQPARRRVVFHLFSDGNASQLESLTRMITGSMMINWTQHLAAAGGDLTSAVQATFHHLVSADVLVVGRSSFAVGAATLSINTVLTLGRPSHGTGAAALGAHCLSYAPSASMQPEHNRSRGDMKKSPERPDSRRTLNVNPRTEQNPT